MTDTTFRSQRLDELMRPLEDKRKAMEKQTVSKVEAECNQNACNSLGINSDMSLVKKSKVKDRKVKKSKVSSSKEEAEVAVVDAALTLESDVGERRREF